MKVTRMKTNDNNHESHRSVEPESVEERKGGDHLKCDSDEIDESHSSMLKAEGTNSDQQKQGRAATNDVWQRHLTYGLFVFLRWRRLRSMSA
jgi:hypothetical protein